MKIDYGINWINIVEIRDMGTSGRWVRYYRGGKAGLFEIESSIWLELNLGGLGVVFGFQRDVACVFYQFKHKA